MNMLNINNFCIALDVIAYIYTRQSCLYNRDLYFCKESLHVRNTDLSWKTFSGWFPSYLNEGRMSEENRSDFLLTNCELVLSVAHIPAETKSTFIPLNGQGDSNRYIWLSRIIRGIKWSSKCDWLEAPECKILQLFDSLILSCTTFSVGHKILV